MHILIILYFGFMKDKIPGLTEVMIFRSWNLTVRM
jgi:hypothetical protein